MPEHFYVYPEYLTGRSRAEGRRVPRTMLTGDLSLEQLEEAARKLGFTVERQEKHYPRDFHHYRGRLKVNKQKGVTKAAFLKRLAAAISATPRSA